MCCYRCTTPLVTEASRRRQNQRVSNPFLVQHTTYQSSQVDNYLWAIFRIRASQIRQVRVGSEALRLCTADERPWSPANGRMPFSVLRGFAYLVNG